MGNGISPGFFERWIMTDHH